MTGKIKLKERDLQKPRIQDIDTFFNREEINMLNLDDKAENSRKDSDDFK